MQLKCLSVAWLQARIIAASLILICNVVLSARAQMSGPPSETDVSPTVNTEVSSIINTGENYDSWSGSLQRQITDLEVPGAVSSLGLKWVRTYNSGNGWSFSWSWRYWGRGWGGDPIAVHLPNG